jgi:hypothetical protein
MASIPPTVFCSRVSTFAPEGMHFVSLISTRIHPHLTAAHPLYISNNPLTFSNHSRSRLHTSTNLNRPGVWRSWKISKSRHSPSSEHFFHRGRCTSLNRSAFSGDTCRVTKSVSCFPGALALEMRRGAMMEAFRRGVAIEVSDMGSHVCLERVSKMLLR